MSSILKALQKLEQDKAARQTREPDISGAITRSSQRRKSQPRWLVPTVMLLVATVSILVTYAVMGGFGSSRQTPAPPAVADIPQERPQAASQPLLAPQAPLSPSETAAPNRLPAAHAPRLPLAPSERPGKTGGIIPVPTPKQGASARTIEPQTAAPLPSPAQAPQAVTAEQPAAAPKPPALRVSGIAWQKDSTSRLAVINGMSVTEGGMVEGAQVEEIFPDRVRFSFKGSTFEIQMGKENHR
ncbi:MAG: general secretion pathway protein GspB [Geobacter sp.]|nr:general secretion pathway protein GspB [Geobacter sp.]